MNTWEDNLYGFVRKEDWLDVGSIVPTRQNDPIDKLFGDEKTDNLMAKWENIASEYGIPVMAQFHGFDTEAQTTFRIPVDSKSIEKGLIKVKINQSERLRALTKSGVVGDQKLYNYVLDDGARLADQVITRTKVAKNELMAYGKVTIKENNLDITVDYGVPAGQTQYVLDLSADADIATQIQAIVDDALDKGVTINGIMTSKKNIAKMRANKTIQSAINGTLSQGQLVTRAALENYLSDEFGIDTIVENDLKYGVSGGVDSNGRPIINQHRYYPESKVTFFATNPGGKIGEGLWGDSPEADAAKFYDVKRAGADPYVYIEQWMEKDPAVLWTKASSLFMPVLFNPYSLFIATVQSDNITTPVAETLAPTDTVYGYTVSDLGENILVGDNAISGTLKYVSSGTLASDWGAGNFLPITFDADDWGKYTSVKVGLDPSAGSGLVELIGHLDDLKSTFKITDKNMQKLVIVATDGNATKTKVYDLSGLTLVQGA